MRKIVVLTALFAASAFAGCFAAEPGPTPPQAPAEAPEDANQTLPALPAAIHDESIVGPSVDPLGWAGINEPCGSQTALCLRYPVEVAGPAHIDVSVAWLAPVNDLDVFLFGDDGFLWGASTQGQPATTESFAADVTAGNYTLVVAPFVNVVDAVTVDVAFSAASPAA